MSKFWLYTLNPCVFTKFGFIAHMLLLIAHVLLLTAHRSLLVAHKIASLIAYLVVGGLLTSYLPTYLVFFFFVFFSVK